MDKPVVTEEMAKLKNTHLMDWLREGYEHCQHGSKDWCQGYLDSARLYIDALEAALAASPAPPVEGTERKFSLGQRVQKHSGSWWQGRVVGFYSTEQTPVGYCVQLDEVPHGPVQIYPEAALTAIGARDE